ncbi:MAG: hypothetical protein ACYDHN_12745 [Solirubrobacteraceae bacterium]
MSRISKICAIAIAMAAIGGTAAASASAAKVLTLYANGEPLPLGNREASPFAITSTAPFTLTTASTGAVVTCTPKKAWTLRGYVKANGTATVRVRIDGEEEFNAVRHCEGPSGTTSVAGPQLAGKLKLKANGEGSLVPLPHVRPAFDMVVGACSYKATSMQALPTYGGPLAVSLKGTFESSEPACAPVVFESNSYAAIWKSGPLIEAFVS